MKQYPKMIIEHEDYCAEIAAPQLYVDNETPFRSGHMTHGMAQFAPGCVIAFHSNCSAVRHGGHTPYGWVEYRISRDSGKTWSEDRKFPYAWKSFVEGDTYISVEKCVSLGDGCITALCLRNTMENNWCCEPWYTPMAVRSTDGGETWSEPVEYSPYPGRTYDALVHDGVIYVLHYCNERFLGTAPEHMYRLYRSTDNGVTFEEVSIIPFDTLRRGYGSLLVDADGRMHAFAYNEGSECELDHAISDDLGVTWTVVEPCYLANRIRNPQTALIDGVYVCHGRGGTTGFVFYTSTDCQHWDEGKFLQPEQAGAFYSNNLNLSDEEGNYLLIHYSTPYQGNRVNVAQTTLRIRKKS